MDYKGFEGEINTGKSETIPNQSMTVREMIEQYRRGLPMEVGKVPVYNGEQELPDLSKMDLVERQEYIDAAAEAFADAKARIDEARKKMQDTKDLEKLEAAIQARLAKIKEDEKGTATQA